jgi:hypothetical protein
VFPLTGSVSTPVTWNGSLFFNARQSGATIVADSTVSFPFNTESFAGTNEAITANGQGFSFKIPNPAMVGGWGAGLGSTTPIIPIDCGNNVVIIGNSCRWGLEFPGTGFARLSAQGVVPTLVGASAGSAAEFPITVTPDTVYTILKCNDRTCLYVDGVHVLTGLVSEPIAASSRLNVFTTVAFAALPFVGDLITDVQYITGITCPTI